MKKQRTCLFLILFSLGALRGQSVFLTNKTQELLLSESNLTSQKPPSYDNKTITWAKLEVFNSSGELFIVEGLSPHSKHVYLLIQKDGRLINKQETGRDKPFPNRWLLHKNFLFPLPHLKGHFTVWLGIQDPLKGDMEFKIRSFHNFSEYAISEYFHLGLYYGLLCVAALYNLFLYLKSKIRIHLFYSFYLIGCTLLSFREDGLGYQFLWPHYPSWNWFLIAYLAQPVFLITFLFYSSSLLGLRQHKTLFRILSSLTITYLLYLPFAALFPDQLFHPQWFIALISTIVYITSLYHWRKDSYARYFAVGFSIVALSLLVNLLRSLSVLPSNVITVYSFNFGIFLEVIVFSMAIAERVRTIQFERNAATANLVEQLHQNDILQKKLIVGLEEKKLLQEKVNRELEAKVLERTTELKEANTKLQQYAQKLDKLNSALDLHNYSLKNQVKEATLSLINIEKVSFEKFQEIFKNEHQCLKTIEQLKWPNGFVCAKCGHSHSSPVQIWYRQKCSRCGTIESVTAQTLFHNIRIPLMKAFYITYTTFSDSETTIEELSQTIDLRKATVWSYRKKVQERILDKKYARVETWQQLILDRPKRSSS